MKIGLLGAGTIGFGVYEIAEKIPGLEITKVLDRRDIPQLRGKLTQDAVELLTSPFELAGYKEAIMEAMYKGTKRNIESETDSKNVEVG